MESKVMETTYEPNKKATEAQYIASYHYTAAQKIGGCVSVLVILSAIITAGVFLCIGLINLIFN